MAVFKMGTVECPEASLATGHIVGGYLEDSSPIEIPLLVLNGAKSGPVLWLGSALHGPEIAGTEVIRRITREVVDPKQLSGTIVGAPMQTPPGVRDHHRLVLREGTDINRVFPGKLGSSLTEEIAYHLWHDGASKANCVVDLHANIHPAVDFVLVRGGTPAADRGLELAKLFEFAVVQSLLAPTETVKGTLMDAALDAGIPAMTVELTPQREMHEDSIAAGVRGLLNLMRAMEMLPGPIEPVSERPIKELLGNTMLVKTSRGGFTHPLKQVGTKVSKDEALLLVRDPYGDVVETVVSPIDGYVTVYPRFGNQSCFSGQTVVFVNSVRQPTV